MNFIKRFIKGFVFQVKYGFRAALYAKKHLQSNLVPFRYDCENVIEFLQKMQLIDNAIEFVYVSNFELQISGIKLNTIEGDNPLAFVVPEEKNKVYLVHENMRALNIADPTKKFLALANVILHESRHLHQFNILKEAGWSIERIQNYIVNTPYQDSVLEEDATEYINNVMYCKKRMFSPKQMESKASTNWHDRIEEWSAAAVN